MEIYKTFMKMLGKFFLITAILFINFELHAEEFAPKIIEKCKEWRSEKCSNSCTESERGKFVECYIDPDFAGKLRWRDCYAVHIGYSCPPCQDFFATNFGGAFKESSCEYFYTAIERKNKDCKNCLQIMHHLQVDISDFDE